jgi:hypothetical protein
MKFIMTPEIMDQIIFGMENQEKTFILDTDTDHVVPAEETEKESFRYIPIPEWKSSDGFQLMEMFVASMRNPIIRERFREALSSGRGVFRSFKNILKERPEIERLWFSFKEKEMKKRVREWYNQLAEVWGLEKLGPEPEDTEELVMSDFSYSYGDGDVAEQVRKYDEDAFSDMFPEADAEELRLLYKHHRQGRVPRSGDTFYLVKTPVEDLAGILWATEGDGNSQIHIIYIFMEFRGLGLFKTLLDRYCGDAYDRGFRTISLTLYGGSLPLWKNLELKGFSEVAKEIHLDLDAWKKVSGVVS